MYVYICLLLLQYTPPSLSIPLFDLSSLSLQASIFLLPFWLNVWSRVGMRDTGYTVSTDAPASDTERDEAHIARQISHSLRVGKFNGGTPTNRDVAYKKLDQSTTSVSKCYPVHPRTAAAPSRLLPVQHRFRIPATPFFLFPFFCTLSLPSLSLTLTFPTPCYFPLRVIIPWDLSYQIPIPSYHTPLFSFPFSLIEPFLLSSFIRLPFNPTLNKTYFSTNLISPITFVRL